MDLYKRPLCINELNANHHTVSVSKCGFFLCREGSAKVLLGTKVYHISRNMLCIYTPFTFLRILEKSNNLSGFLEEDEMDAYFPIIGSIDIRKRLQIRNESCVTIPEQYAADIECLLSIIDEAKQHRQHLTNDITQEFIDNNYIKHLHYALCLKVLSAYFNNPHVTDSPQTKDDSITNRFIVSVYENCHRHRTIKYYAAQQNLSPYYFSTIIKNCSGRSASHWIENAVMALAKQHLHNPEKSIQEIADNLNFPDQSTFARYFKHLEGITPTEYRTRNV